MAKVGMGMTTSWCDEGGGGESASWRCMSAGGYCGSLCGSLIEW